MKTHKIKFEITLQVDLKSAFRIIRLFNLKAIHIRSAVKLLTGEIEYPKRIGISKLEGLQIAYLRDPDFEILGKIARVR